MKKVIIGLMALMMIIMPGYAFSGGLWSMVKNSGLENIKTKPYAIEVKGTNIRAYIFEVPEMKSICISVWGSDTQTLQCKTYKEIGISEK